LIYAGIDAGGTSSKCMVVNEKNEILARLKTGPANYQVVGINKAILEIKKLLKLVCDEIGINSIDILGVGMAGAGSSGDINIIENKLLPLKNVKKSYITNDGEIAVLGAHGGKEGIVLIAGTGSIVYGITNNHQTIRGGGWGPLLGDEGSGFWIGMQAIKLIIKASEGRARKTSLEKAVLNYLKVNSLRELVTFIHQIPLPREKVASLTPIVIEEMLKNDKIAEQIIYKGLNELALTVRVVFRKMKTNINEIAVMGGIFTNKHIYQIFYDMMLNTYRLKVIKPKYSADYGAVLYGAINSGKKDIFI